MVDRRIMTMRVECVLSGTELDKLTSDLRVILLQPTIRTTIAFEKSGTALIDKRPALIARCTDVDDVITSVRFAREHDLLVSMRGGGHSAAGRAVCEKGLMIDLSPMKGIQIDAKGRTARAEPGLRLGEFDGKTQSFGLATTLGVASDTGIAASPLVAGMVG
jgi:FAD/FMN-containing dehydrogenase